MAKEVSCPWKPLNGYVVLKANEVEVSPGGIIYPDGTAKEEMRRFEVVRVGEPETTEFGTKRGCDVKVGDTIMACAPMYSNDGEVEVDGEKFMLLKTKFIAAVMDK